MAISRTNALLRFINWRRDMMILAVVLWTITTAPHPAASQNGFLSVDCGLSSGSYVDAAGISWTADGERWPNLADEGTSAAATVTPPVSLSGQKSLITLRYFPSMNQTAASKFCYDLQPPVNRTTFYMLRASFWVGSQLPDGYPSTRINGVVSFRVIVDTYAGVTVNIPLPQTSVWFEEMYVRPVGPKLSFCLSAASGSSDAPFVNAIELRPLPDTLYALKMVNKTGNALRLFDRQDFAAPSSAPPFLRYPNDTIDRMWFRSTEPAANTIETSEAVTQENNDLPPTEMLQTCEVASTLSRYSFYNVTTLTEGSRGLTVAGRHSYYAMMWLPEVDARINASGLRVFNLTTNGQLFYANVDSFNLSSHKLYWPLAIYTPNPLGPYTDYFDIVAFTDPSSLYPPSMAGIEIMQLLDDPISPPTLSSDVDAIQDLISGFSNLSSVSGDPCLPSAYKYPWLNCTTNNDNVMRVVSISLSNYNIAPGKTIPSSINNLDFVTHILLDGNALEGRPPDFSNLLNLQVLNLSNNKLNGSVPESLASLPKLTYLNLRNNNFSGLIPTLLQQKEGLTLEYDGNQFLCTTDNAACGNPAHARKSSTSLIIGVLVGVVALFFLCFVFILFMCKRKRHPPNSHLQMVTSESKETHEVLRHTQIIKVSNIARAFQFKEIIDATQDFSTILGKGGFGSVYKGILDDGLNVAIKVLSDASQQGEQEFLNEVSLLSRIHHKNLVGLIGYCIEKKLVLVYEYMSNGSLFDALFGNTRSVPLSWIERLRILLDAAQGLAYLHHGCSSLIIHRDVKSSNILLTENLEAKMSDFGISRLKINDDDAITTRLIGSMGYLDPEFASTLRLSEKVDVYSFGVVIFETLCGQPPLVKDPNKKTRDVPIVEWVRPFYERCALEEVVDLNLGTRYNIASIWKVVEVAMACVHFDGEKRPTMIEVYNELLEASKLESSQTISPTNTTECLSYMDDVQVHAR